jgi:flagellar protein FliS
MTGRPYGGAQSYLQTQVRSSSPVELVVLLYDGALRSASTASDAMSRKDVPARREALNRLMAIVSELQNTLDLERGGQVAADLDRLYAYMLSRLVDAIAAQDHRPIDEVRRLLATLRDGWQQVAAQAAQAAPMGSSGARP